MAEAIRDLTTEELATWRSAAVDIVPPPESALQSSPVRGPPLPYTNLRDLTAEDYRAIPRVGIGAPRALGRGAAGLVESLGNRLAMSGLSLARPEAMPVPDFRDEAMAELGRTRALVGLDGPIPEIELAERQAKLAGQYERPEPASAPIKAAGNVMLDLGELVAGFANKQAQRPSLRDPYAEHVPITTQLKEEPFSTAGREITQQAPNLALSAAGGLAGKAVLGTVGAFTGAAATSYGLESGDIYGEIIGEFRRHGVKPTDADRLFAIGVANNRGAINAALDALLPGSVASKAARNFAVKKYLSAEVAKHLGKEAGKGVAKEVPTELIQEGNTLLAVTEGTKRPGVEQKKFTPTEIRDRMIRAGIAAGGLGAAGGGVGGVAQIERRSTPKTESEPQPQPQPQPDAGNDVPVSTGQLLAPDEAVPFGRTGQLLAPDEAVPPVPPAAPVPEAQATAAPVDAATLGVTGSATEIFAEDNKYHPAQWRVVEADAVDASLTKGRSQYRDRTRAASEAQIASIANEPDFRRLSDSVDLDRGSPVLSKDGAIVAGNGRVAGLRRAYASGKAADYRAKLVARVAALGLDPEKVAAIRNPILVRVLTGDEDVSKLAGISNEGGALRMSALEQAALDAERIGPIDDMKMREDGSLSRADNAALVRRLLSKTPQNQYGAFISADGELSAEGGTRIRNAVLYRAYGDSDVLARLIEATTDEQRNVANALLRAAPELARMRDGIANGSLFDADIVPDVVQAAGVFARLRAAGKSLDALLAQRSLFDDAFSAEVMELVKLFERNIRSSRAIADVLIKYVELLEARGNPSQTGIFGANQKPQKLELLRASDDEQSRPAGQSTGQQTDNRQGVDRGGQGTPAETGQQPGEARPAAASPEGNTASVVAVAGKQGNLFGGTTAPAAAVTPAAPAAPKTDGAVTWTESTPAERAAMLETLGVQPDMANRSANESFTALPSGVRDQIEDLVRAPEDAPSDDTAFGAALGGLHKTNKDGAPVHEVLKLVVQHGDQMQKAIASIILRSNLIRNIKFFPASQYPKHRGGKRLRRSVEAVFAHNGLKGDQWRPAGIFSRTNRLEAALHESIHAFLFSVARGVRLGEIDTKSNLGQSIAQMDVLRKFFAKQSRTGLDPETRHYIDKATQTLDEFITYSLTNQQVQAAMKDIKAPGGTVWSRFRRIVGKVFNIPAKSDNLLDAVLQATGSTLLEAEAVASQPQGAGTAQTSTEPEFTEEPITEATPEAEALTLPPAMQRIRDAYYKKVADPIVKLLDALSDPVWNLPDSIAYKRLRYKALGIVDDVERRVKRYRKQLLALSPEDQAETFRYLSSRVATTTKISTKEARMLASAIKDEINEIGVALVAMGIISEDARLRFEDRYLPRLYMFHLLKKPGAHRRGGGRLTASILSYAKRRREALSDVWNNAAKGERRMMLGMAGIAGSPGTSAQIQNQIDIARQEWHELSDTTKAALKGVLGGVDEMPEQVRKVMLGEIEDPAYLVPMAILRPARDLALLGFLQSLVSNRKWVPNQAIMRFTNPVTGTVSRGTPQFYKKEAQTLREMAEGMNDDATATQTRRVAAAMDRQADTAIAATGNIDADTYRQLDDSPRYGALRGLWVHRDIYNDIVGQRLGIHPDDRTFVDEWFGSPVGKGAKINAVFKTAKVPLNLPSVARNIITGFVQLQQSGVPLWRIIPLAIQAARDIRNNGDYWQAAKRGGVGAASFAAQELYRAETDLLDLQKRRGELGTFATLHWAGAHLANIAGDSYQAIEAFLKVMKIIDEMQRKGSPEATAIREAHHWLLDYSLVNPAIRVLRNVPIGAPFITFLAKQMPRTAETVLKHPQRVLSMIGLYYAVQYAILAAAENDDDRDKIAKLLDKGTRDRGHMLWLPQKNEQGEWTLVDLSYFAPWAPYTTFMRAHARRFEEGGAGALFGQDIEDNVVRDALQTTGLFGGPIPSFLMMAKTGDDGFTGRQAFEISPDAADNYANAAIYMSNLFMPSMFTARGFVGLQQGPTGELEAGGKLGDIVHDRQYAGKPSTTPLRAAASLVGVNTRRVNESEELARTGRATKARIGELKRTMRREAAKVSDPERQQRIVKRYTDLIQKQEANYQRKTGTDD